MSFVTYCLTTEGQTTRKKRHRKKNANALKYEFTKPVDILRNINEGFYANKLTVHMHLIKH